MPSLPGIFPDYSAPVVRNANSEREITMMRWGMPTSQRAMMDATRKRAQRLEAKGRPIDFKELLPLEPDSGGTNIRNTSQRALETLARTRQPLPRAVHIVFRIRHDRRQEGASVVCRRPESAADGIRRHLDQLDLGAEGEGG